MQNGNGFMQDWAVRGPVFCDASGRQAAYRAGNLCDGWNELLLDGFDLDDKLDVVRRDHAAVLGAGLHRSDIRDAPRMRKMGAAIHAEKSVYCDSTHRIQR
jgi:hypothetical protein